MGQLLQSTLVKKLTKNNVFGGFDNFKEENNILISNIDEDPNSSYWCKKYGKDTYLTVIFFYQKLDNEKCYSNGYYYTTSRTFKLGDILMEQRKIKLEKILK